MNEPRHPTPLVYPVRLAGYNGGLTMAQPSTAIRPARVGDVPEMVRIVNNYAERGLMIHRSLAEMYEHVRAFQVAERVAADERGGIIGCVGLRVMWADLAECYALAVAPSARGRGVGGMLVDASIESARQLGVRRVFALTYEQRFFERHGFHAVNRWELPLKVWGECIRCPKHDACDEIAVVREIAVPEALRPQDVPTLPTTDEAGEYDVPIPRPVPAVLRIDARAGEDAATD